MQKDRAKELLDGFSGRRIVVVGDVMLDEYVWGQVNRISPEAPVMVVDAQRYSQVPGGAANVVNNLCALGATASVCGVLGDDDAGGRLADALAAEGAETSGLLSLKDRPTTRKTRIIAHSQQVVRVDHERRGVLDDETVARLVATIDRLAVGVDAIVVSDYQKGVVSHAVLEACCRHALRGCPVTGNLKPRAIGAGCALTVITLNLSEASQALGGDALDTDDAIDDAGRRLLEISGAEHILITQGSAGLALYSRSAPFRPSHIPARPVEVYDVAGAGDTVISALTLALAAGATPVEAVTLANIAAAEAVKKLGVSTVTVAEILASF